MWKAVFVVLGAIVGFLGSFLAGAAIAFVSDPPGGLDGGVALWIWLVGTLIGVPGFSLLGFRQGCVLDARAGREDSPQTRKADFAVLGAVGGYFIAGVGSRCLAYAFGLKGDAAMAIFLFGILPVCGAAFSLLGFRLGSALDRRARQTDSPQKWQATFTAIGAAVGPVVGFFTVYHLVGPRGGEYGNLVAFLAGLLLGVPIGGSLFCLLGLCLGSALDRRSPRNGVPPN